MKSFKNITKAAQPHIGILGADVNASNVEKKIIGIPVFKEKIRITNNVIVHNYVGEEEDRFHLSLMPIINYEKWQKNNSLNLKKTLIVVRENWNHRFFEPFKKWCKASFFNGEWIFSENTIEYFQQNYISYLLLKNYSGQNGTYKFICRNFLNYLLQKKDWVLTFKK